MKGYRVWIDPRKRVVDGKETKDKFYYVMERWKTGEKEVGGIKKPIYKTESTPAGQDLDLAKKIRDKKRSDESRAHYGFQNTSILLGAAIAKYAESCLTLEHGTQISYGNSMDKLATHFGQEIAISAITKEALLGFRVELLKEHAVNGAITILGTVRSFFSFCVKMGWIQNSPASKITHGLREKDVARFLGEDEIDKLLFHCLTKTTIRGPKFNLERRQQFLDILLTSISTGMRRGDIVSIKKSWIHDGDILIPANVTKNKKPKQVPINPDLLPTITKYLNSGNSEMLFPDWTANQISDYMQMVGKRAGIGRVRFHDMRHTFASRYLQLADGANVGNLMVLLGHKNLSTTQRYAHFEKSHLRATVHSMKNGFFKKAPLLKVV